MPSERLTSMLVPRIARALLAGVFLSGGISALKHPEGHAELAGPALDPALDVLAGLLPIAQHSRTVALVRVDAVVKIGAALLLATGRAPRVAATALAAGLVPTTVIGHRFWEMDDPENRLDQRIHVIKNLGLLGGLMLVAADSGG
jgi:putative oxidoreductase